MSWLEKKLGFCYWWEEPNDYSDIGKRIRLMLKGEYPKEPDSFEFQRMYVIDRAQNIFCLLKENFRKKKVTILARYALSTIAYGMLSVRPADDFIKLHNDVLGPSMIWPDLWIILDITPEIFEERLKALYGRVGTEPSPQYFEKLEVLERVRKNYLSLVNRTDIGPVVVLDGAPSEEEVFEGVKRVIEERFELVRE